MLDIGEEHITTMMDLLACSPDYVILDCLYLEIRHKHPWLQQFIKAEAWSILRNGPYPTHKVALLSNLRPQASGIGPIFGLYATGPGHRIKATWKYIDWPSFFSCYISSFISCAICLYQNSSQNFCHWSASSQFTYSLLVFESPVQSGFLTP